MTRRRSNLSSKPTTRDRRFAAVALPLRHSKNICIKNGFLLKRPKALLKGLRMRSGIETGAAAKIGRNPLTRTLRYRSCGDAQAAELNIASFIVITLLSTIVIVLKRQPETGVVGKQQFHTAPATPDE